VIQGRPTTAFFYGPMRSGKPTLWATAKHNSLYASAQKVFVRPFFALISMNGSVKAVKDDRATLVARSLRASDDPGSRAAVRSSNLSDGLLAP